MDIEKWRDSVNDNPSKWLFEQACQFVGEANMIAAAAWRDWESSEPIAVRFVAATQRGLLTTTGRWHNQDCQADWSLTPWHRLGSVDIAQRGQNNALEIRKVIAHDPDGKDVVQLPLNSDGRELTGHELEVLQAIAANM